MTRKASACAVLICFLIAGCEEKSSHSSISSDGDNTDRSVQIVDLIRSPEEHLSRTLCLSAVARASWHGVMLFDESRSKYGVPADLYTSDVDSQLEREFIEWVKAHRRSGQLGMIFNGVLIRSDRYPSYPYEMKIIDILFVQQDTGTAPKISNYCPPN